MSASLRLDRLLAGMGYGSRRDVQRLVRAGKVTLDGAAVASAELKVAVTPELCDRLQVAGARLDPPPGMALMLHKPLGVTCSHRETGRLVYELLPSRWRARTPPLATVGRLDKETSGLLLLTDDGALLHRIISPRHHVTKRYRAALARPLEGGEAERFASGALVLEGEDKPLAPAALAPLTPTEALLTITEGRYHQVRRMFAAVGNHVEALHREAVGALELPADLAPGQWRLLGAGEIAAVFA